MVAAAATEVSTDRLAVLLHGCQVPSPLAPRSLSLRVHVVDIESGRELHTSEQTAVQAQTSESTGDIR